MRLGRGSQMASLPAVALHACLSLLLRAHAPRARRLRRTLRRYLRAAFLLLCMSKFTHYVGVVRVCLGGLMFPPVWANETAETRISSS